MSNKKKTLMQTITGENYMLARVHFAIRDKPKVERILARLKCTIFDAHQKRWTWLFDDEARDLKFKVPYYKVPLANRPIVLGSIFLRTNTTGYLNTNSFDRATKFLTFFDKKFGRNVIEFTDIEVVNKLIDSVEFSPSLHQKYFDSTPARSNKADVAWERMQMIAGAPISPERKQELLHKRSLENAKKPLDLIERLPCNFYDPDGVYTLETALKMREVIAMQHWRGNTGFSFHDLIEPIVKGVGLEMNESGPGGF